MQYLPLTAWVLSIQYIVFTFFPLAENSENGVPLFVKVIVFCIFEFLLMAICIANANKETKQ